MLLRPGLFPAGILCESMKSFRPRTVSVPFDSLMKRTVSSWILGSAHVSLKEAGEQKVQGLSLKTDRKNYIEILSPRFAQDIGP